MAYYPSNYLANWKDKSQSIQRKRIENYEEMEG